MQFLELPLEVLQMIVGQLPTPALINVSRSCRMLHSLTLDAIHQYELDHFFNYLDLSERTNKKHDWYHPLQILYNIRQEPDIALHIKAFLWDCSAQDYGLPYDMARPPPYWPKCDDPGNFTRKECKRLMAALKGCSDYTHWIALLTEESRSMWGHLIDTGAWEPLFGLLLMRCPNVELLRISRSYDHTHFLLNQLEPFLDYAIANRLPLFGHEGSGNKSGGLQNLRTLIMDTIDLSREHVVLPVQKWLCVPTLRKFGGLYLKNFDSWMNFPFSSQMPLWDENLYHLCNLEVVVVALASFTLANLAICVRGMPKLKQLIYSDDSKFDMLGRTVNGNGHEITWNSVHNFVEHFLQAYGENQLKARGLQVAARTDTLFEIFQKGCQLSEEWTELLGSEHCTTADVEHYLQCAS